jgi:hypothetical protein
MEVALCCPKTLYVSEIDGSNKDNAAEVLLNVTPDKLRENVPQAVSTSALHIKKKANAPMVVSEVRRSDMLKAISRGFKGKHCEKANCFCCSVEHHLFQGRLSEVWVLNSARLCLVL